MNFQCFNWCFSDVAEGKTEYGFQYDIFLLYEHKLARSAFNMVVGPFGSVLSIN